MTKYINRANHEGLGRYNKNISSEEEWAHITGELKQSDELDPMSPKARVIEFSNNLKRLSKEDRVREKSKDFADQIANTDQYFKFANGVIKERVDRLRQIKEDDQKFSEQISLLQDRIKIRYDLDKINPKNVTISDMHNLLSVLEEECEKMKDKLLYQELIIQRTKDEIAKKRNHINKIREEIKRKGEQVEPITDPITRLQVELKRSGIPDSDKIFDLLEQIKSSMNSFRNSL